MKRVALFSNQQSKSSKRLRLQQQQDEMKLRLIKEQVLAAQIQNERSELALQKEKLDLLRDMEKTLPRNDEALRKQYRLVLSQIATPQSGDMVFSWSEAIMRFTPLPAVLAKLVLEYSYFFLDFVERIDGSGVDEFTGLSKSEFLGLTNSHIVSRELLMAHDLAERDPHIYFVSFFEKTAQTEHPGPITYLPRNRFVIRGEEYELAYPFLICKSGRLGDVFINHNSPAFDRYAFICFSLTSFLLVGILCLVSQQLRLAFLQFLALAEMRMTTA